MTAGTVDLYQLGLRHAGDLRRESSTMGHSLGALVSSTGGFFKAAIRQARILVQTTRVFRHVDKYEVTVTDSLVWWEGYYATLMDSVDVRDPSSSPEDLIEQIGELLDSFASTIETVRSFRVTVRQVTTNPTLRNARLAKLNNVLSLQARICEVLERALWELLEREADLAIDAGDVTPVYTDARALFETLPS